MATDERLFDIFRELERPFVPDPAFAQRLYDLLRVEAGFIPAARPIRRRWLPTFPAGLLPRPLVLTPRLILLALLAILLAACVAALAYIAIQGWLSTGPRGVQFSDEFTFTEVYRDGGQPVAPGPRPISTYYADFAISHDGSAIYAVRMPSYPERAATLVRLTGHNDPTLQRAEVLDYAELTEPALWDPGFDASAVDIGILLFNSDDDTFAVAPDGQVFVVAGAYGRERVPVPHAEAIAEEYAREFRAQYPDMSEEELQAEVEKFTTRQPIVSAALIVVRPDGSRQKVLTIGELVEAGLLTTDGGEASIAVAASAADRLWVKSEVFGEGSGGLPSLFQVVDPDRDGDWSNRVVLPLALPDSIPAPPALPKPGEEGRLSWLYRQPTAEVSSGQVDRSHSVLLPERAGMHADACRRARGAPVGPRLRLHLRPGPPPDGVRASRRRPRAAGRREHGRSDGRPERRRPHVRARRPPQRTVADVKRDDIGLDLLFSDRAVVCSRQFGRSATMNCVTLRK